jgi:hypothetical protein
MPSKDEIAVIDGRALTITHFLSIRRQMRQPSAESAYWLGLASLALEKDAKTKGKTFSLLDALLLSRYAIGDISRLEASAVLQAYFEPVAVPSTQEDVKKAVDQLLKRSWIQNGLIPISQL